MIFWVYLSDAAYVLVCIIDCIQQSMVDFRYVLWSQVTQSPIPVLDTHSYMHPVLVNYCLLLNTDTSRQAVSLIPIPKHMILPQRFICRESRRVSPPPPPEKSYLKFIKYCLGGFLGTLIAINLCFSFPRFAQEGVLLSHPSPGPPISPAIQCTSLVSPIKFLGQIKPISHLNVG